MSSLAAIDLNALVGRRFRIGGVPCYGQRLAEPCSWLQQLTPPGTLRALVHRGGLRADILASGEVALGEGVDARGIGCPPWCSASEICPTRASTA